MGTPIQEMCIRDSPAIDTGAVVSLTDDFDGDERPMGDGYDIGADEFDPLMFKIIDTLLAVYIYKGYNN